MKKNRLSGKQVKIIMMLLMILIIIGVILLMFLSKTKDKELLVTEKNEIYANTSEGIIKEEEYNGIRLSNISMLTENEYTTFSADVTNVTESDIETEKLHISLRDKDDKELRKLLAYIPNGLKEGETKVVTSVTYGDFRTAVSKKIMN